MLKLENKLQKELSVAQYELDNISEDHDNACNNTADEKEVEKNKIMNVLLKKFGSERQSEGGDDRSSKVASKQ